MNKNNLEERGETIQLLDAYRTGDVDINPSSPDRPWQNN